MQDEPSAQELFETDVLSPQRRRRAEREITRATVTSALTLAACLAQLVAIVFLGRDDYLRFKNQTAAACLATSTFVYLSAFAVCYGAWRRLKAALETRDTATLDTAHDVARCGYGFALVGLTFGAAWLIALWLACECPA